MLHKHQNNTLDLTSTSYVNIIHCNTSACAR